MHGKSIVIFNTLGGATSCILCGRYEILFLKWGWGQNWQPVIGKLLTLTDPNIMHCFIRHIQWSINE